jgi:serine/threonine-protein kinase HipA
MNDVPDTVAVQLDAVELGPQRSIGELRRVGSGARGAVSFGYDPAWLADRHGFAIDPLLGFYPGPQYAPSGGLPGILADTAPDRWGRTLLERREALAARQEGRSPRRLDDWDFLLGVSDRVRMGALRLRDGDAGAFIEDGPMSIPPLTRLRALEHAARELERTSGVSVDDEAAMLALLLAPGSSLGGARPKATFADEDGALWIAKFPSRSDRDDIGAWEYLVTRLAERVGIAIPETRLLQLTVDQRTFCARRFDRDHGSRVLYASGMTLTGKTDGQAASYLDLAEAIADHGAPGFIDEDLEQLFRRIVFNILVSNRDDHLRNHGFLRSDRGWRLAPAFDLNPSPAKAEHELSINENLPVPDVALALETAPFYRVSKTRARQVVDEVAEAVGSWRRLAAEIHFPDHEVELMAQAFVAAERVSGL